MIIMTYHEHPQWHSFRALEGVMTLIINLIMITAIQIVRAVAYNLRRVEWVERINFF